MPPVPDNPKIYHITHVDNLGPIAQGGGLLSDARMLRADGRYTVVGMSDIKRRRLEGIEVACHPGTRVGDYVPFYFCPRSIMLYILHMANHPDLAYRGGQRPLDKVDWQAVASTDFRDPVIKEGKQAEFLMHDWFPWELIDRIGVIDRERRAQVEQAMGTARHKPLVTVESGWYY